MLGWMCYVIVVSLLLGLAAWAFERSARLRKQPTRWVWVTSIVASLLIPLVVSSVSVQLPQMPGTAPATTPTTAVLRDITLREFSPSSWVAANTGPIATSPSLDTVLKAGWLVMSLGLLLVVAVSAWHLQRQGRRWTRGSMAGVPVDISDNTGPAIVGLRHPRIVVPRWLTTASVQQQELVIAHEQAHLDGRDAQVLMVALAILICIPWNIPLWFQFRRLRFAIEIDCDARVLRRGYDVGRYGETLIAVGERQSGNIAVVAAMSESKSFLEQRIGNMLRQKTKWTWTSAAALACLGLSLVAGAAQVSPPDNTPTAPAVNAASAPNQPSRKEITLDSALLDRYVGFYRLHENAVMTVTREGDQLAAQLTGQRSLPVFAETDTRFFFKAVNAQFTFVADASGPATALILHQGGGNMTMPRIDATAAQAVEARTVDRMKSQTANPHSEAAIGRLIAGTMSGKPNYAEMSPALAEATRKQLPKLQANMQELGAVKSIKFLGVGAQGTDSYTVWHENGASHWRISMDSNGIIALAAVSPGP